ncbi:hypothetical protein [Bifidobacterium cuniculi]|uniref:Transposase n=1 Tax=Bifidobacterium cuniculi TaxID=1688 RepID=A0A087AWV3_9BIFI|nr:hypothetical protein [Bifidobacterium cuniculi]KFI63253.1 hypothetical protein BCUN_1183 [Bifidobacterium cuniculi]
MDRVVDSDVMTFEQMPLDADGCVDSSRPAVRPVQDCSWQRCVVHLERDVMGRIRGRKDDMRQARQIIEQAIRQAA